MGRRRSRRPARIGRGARWAVAAGVGRRSLRIPLATYLVFVAVMCGLYFLAGGIPFALDRARGMVAGLGREVSFLLR